jgi:hypothetical protein
MVRRDLTIKVTLHVLEVPPGQSAEFLQNDVLCVHSLLTASIRLWTMAPTQIGP